MNADKSSSACEEKDKKNVTVMLARVPWTFVFLAAVSGMLLFLLREPLQVLYPTTTNVAAHHQGSQPFPPNPPPSLNKKGKSNKAAAAYDANDLEEEEEEEEDEDEDWRDKVPRSKSAGAKMTEGKELRVKESPYLLHLTHYDFDLRVNNMDTVLVMFMASWCGHCKATLPELQRASNVLQKKFKKENKAGVAYAVVDCGEATNRMLCERENIARFPTLVVMTRNALQVDADQAESSAESAHMLRRIVPLAERTKDFFVHYLLRFLSPQVQRLSPDERENLETYDQLDAMAVLWLSKQKTSADELALKAFNAMGKAIRAELEVRYAYADANDKETPRLTVYRRKELPFDYAPEMENTLEKWDTKRLHSFLHSETLPLVGELDPHTFAKYLDSKLPVFQLFYLTQQERIESAGALMRVAQKHRGKINVATVDAATYAQHAQQLGLGNTNYPAVLVLNLTSGTKHAIFSEKGFGAKIREEEMHRFADAVVQGTEPHFIKSEKLPEIEEPHENVFTMTGASFDRILNADAEMDVLVLFYAEWCEHCRRMEPDFVRLGAILKAQGAKVRLARIEATKNDVPDSAEVKVRGFPTIALYRFGDAIPRAEKVKVHDGARDLAALAAFLASHATPGRMPRGGLQIATDNSLSVA